MSFADAHLEVRGRFMEALQVINRLDPGVSQSLAPSTDPDKALRGLLLVAIYSAMERGVNAYVEEALAVVTSHASRVKNCIPEVQAIFHYPRIQSLRDCSDDNSLSKSIELFSMLTQDLKFSVASNPFRRAFRMLTAQRWNSAASSSVCPTSKLRQWRKAA